MLIHRVNQTLWVSRLTLGQQFIPTLPDRTPPRIPNTTRGLDLPNPGSTRNMVAGGPDALLGLVSAGTGDAGAPGGHGAPCDNFSQEDAGSPGNWNPGRRWDVGQ